MTSVYCKSGNLEVKSAKKNTYSDSNRIWAIRAGRGGEAHELFLQESVVALADAGLGDLSKLDNSRDAFYAAYREIHPDETRTGSAGIAGKFFRFIHEVSVGDLMVYPSLHGKIVYVGNVVSTYAFTKRSAFPHRRFVEWHHQVPKGDFSVQLRYELGAARTFFALKKNENEIRAAIDGRSVYKIEMARIELT